jgi:AMP-binding enzyme
VFLSYLPLAHIFDRVAEETFLSLGGSIGYWQGSPKTLLDDVGALRPTIFVGVPRIFDRIYTGVSHKARLCLQHALLVAAAYRVHVAPLQDIVLGPTASARNCAPHSSHHPCMRLSIRCHPCMPAQAPCITRCRLRIPLRPPRDRT